MEMVLQKDDKNIEENQKILIKLQVINQFLIDCFILFNFIDRKH